MSQLVGANGKPLSAAEPEPSSGAPQIVEADTAFILMNINGEWIVSTDLNAPVTTRRYPTPDDITGAAACMLKDRTAEAAANLTVMTIEQRQAEAMKRVRQQQFAAQAQAALKAEQQGRGRR